MLKFMRNWVYVKDDVSNKVSSLVSPISDNTLFTKFKFDNLFESVLVTLHIFLDFANSLKARFGWHKLKNGVHHECTSHLTLESWGLETSKNLELLMWKFNWILNIEEAWNFTNLLEICLSKSLLDDNVNQVLTNRVCWVRKFSI
jgi:hypothetical protein